MRFILKRTLLSMLLVSSISACSAPDSGSIIEGDLRIELSAEKGLQIFHQNLEILSSQSAPGEGSSL